MARLTLQIGHEVQCDKCGAWYVLDRTPNWQTLQAQVVVRDYLYFICEGHRYFAGSIGDRGRWKIRRGKG